MKTSTITDKISFTEWQANRNDLRSKENRYIIIVSFIVSLLILIFPFFLFYNNSSVPNKPVVTESSALVLDLSPNRTETPTSPLLNKPTTLAKTEPLTPIQKLLPKFPVSNILPDIPRIEKFSKLKIKQPSQHIIPQHTSQSGSNSTSTSKNNNTDHPSEKDQNAQVSHTSSTSANWQGMVLNKFERFKHYPPEAQADDLEGTAILHITINRQGIILTNSLAKSSGYLILDREVLTLSHRVKKLPPPPDDIQGLLINLDIPIEFHIKQ